MTFSKYVYFAISRDSLVAINRAQEHVQLTGEREKSRLNDISGVKKREIEHEGPGYDTLTTLMRVDLI